MLIQKIKYNSQDFKTTFAIIVALLISLVSFYLVNGEIFIRLLIAIAIFYSISSIVFHPKISITNDIMHPAVIVKVIMIIGYFIGSIVLSYQDKIEENVLAITVVFGLFFVFSLDTITYYLYPDAQSKTNQLNLVEIESSVKKYQLKKIFIFLYMFSWLWRIYALSQGLLQGTLLGTHIKVGAAGNLIGVFNNLGQIFYIGLIIISKTSGLLALPFELLWGIFAGSKSAMLYSIFPFLFIGLKKGYLNITKKTISFGMIGIVLFLASFSIIYLYRLESSKFIYAFGVDNFSLLTILSNMDLAKIQFGNIYLTFFQRINLAEYFYNCLVYMEYSNAPFWYGKSLVPVFSWYIPRFFWPDKYSISTGHWFAQEVYGWGFKARTEVGMTIWGDGYINFGFIGAILIPLVWFLAIVYLYKDFQKRGYFPFLLLSSIYLKMILSIEQNIATPLIALMQHSLLIGLFFAVIKSTSLFKKLYKL